MGFGRSFVELRFHHHHNRKTMYLHDVECVINKLKKQKHNEPRATCRYVEIQKASYL